MYSRLLVLSSLETFLGICQSLKKRVDALCVKRNILIRMERWGTTAVPTAFMSTYAESEKKPFVSCFHFAPAAGFQLHFISNLVDVNTFRSISGVYQTSALFPKNICNAEPKVMPTESAKYPVN